MKTRFTPGCLLVSLLLATGVPGRADSPPAQAPPAPAAPPRELTIVVVGSLNRPGDFDRIDIIFTKVFEKRKWPVKIKVERFAADTDAHDTELRIFYQSIREETVGDQTFRAWMTLTDHGKKTDFGVIKFQYYPYATEPREDVLEKVLRGAAVIAADKIEPILFPKADVPKP